MTHLYTRGTEYGLLALQVMLEDPHRNWRVPEICDHSSTPEQFTRKILQSLVHSGILRSTRGPGGGFRFARPPEGIALFEVVQAVEDKARFDLCILGFAVCSETRPCALHYLWAPIKASALEMLRERTVADLATIPMSKKTRDPEGVRRISQRNSRKTKR